MRMCQKLHFKLIKDNWIDALKAIYLLPSIVNPVVMLAIPVRICHDP